MVRVRKRRGLRCGHGRRLRGVERDRRFNRLDHRRSQHVSVTLPIASSQALIKLGSTVLTPVSSFLLNGGRVTTPPTRPTRPPCPTQTRLPGMTAQCLQLACLYFLFWRAFSKWATTCYVLLVISDAYDIYGYLKYVVSIHDLFYDVNDPINVYK
jgi:hypothetical protein